MALAGVQDDMSDVDDDREIDLGTAVRGQEALDHLQLVHNAERKENVIVIVMLSFIVISSSKSSSIIVIIFTVRGGSNKTTR